MPGLRGPKYIVPSFEITPSDYDRVGIRGVQIHKLLKNNIRFPDTFVVTADAFDDFIQDGDIISHISEILDKNLSQKDLGTVSKKIFDVIVNTPLRTEFLKQIDHEYSILQRHEKVMFLTFQPSFHTKNAELIEAVKVRDLVLIKSLENLTDIVKEIWAELFTAEMIEKRLNNETFDIASLAIVVFRNLPYESSGKVSTNQHESEMQIQAEFGDVDNDFFYADEYLCDYRKTLILEKKINLQTRMLVRRKNELVSVPVSKEWQKKPKLSDHYIELLISQTRKLTKTVKKDFLFHFGLYRGDLYLFNFTDTKISELLEKHNKIWNTAARTEFQQQVIEADFANDLQKILTISPPYYEIKSEPSSLKSIFVDRLRMGLGTKGFLDEFGHYTDIYLNLEASGLNALGTMQKYSGLFMDLGLYSDLQNSSFSLSEYYELFKKYTAETANLIYQNTEVPFLVKLSDYKINNHNFEEYLELLSVQLMVIKKLLVEYSYKNLNLVLPSLTSLEDLRFIYKLFNATELNSIKSDNKVYLTVTTPSFLYEINRFDFDTKNFLDGIVIDIAELMKKFFQRDKYTKRDYKIISELLQKRLVEERSHKYKVMLKLNKDNKFMAKEFLNWKPDAFIVDFVEY